MRVCGYAGVRGTVPTGRVERMVVLVSYAHNEREDIDIDIDGASWLEGQLRAWKQARGTAIRGVPKAASPRTRRRELRRSLGRLPSGP